MFLVYMFTLPDLRQIAISISMTAKTRNHIGLIITNIQCMYGCDNSLTLHYVSHFEDLLMAAEMTMTLSSA